MTSDPGRSSHAHSTPRRPVHAFAPPWTRRWARRARRSRARARQRRRSPLRPGCAQQLAAAHALTRRQVEKYRPKSIADVIAHADIVDTSARARAGGGSGPLTLPPSLAPDKGGPATPPAAARPAGHGQDQHHPGAGPAAVRPLVPQHDAGAERFGRARHRRGAQPDLRLRLHQAHLQHRIQTDRAGRVRRDDEGRAVCAAARDRKVHAQHALLPHLQLRLQSHSRAAEPLHPLPLRTPAQGMRSGASARRLRLRAVRPLPPPKPASRAAAWM